MAEMNDPAQYPLYGITTAEVKNGKRPNPGSKQAFLKARNSFPLPSVVKNKLFAFFKDAPFEWVSLDQEDFGSIPPDQQRLAVRDILRLCPDEEIEPAVFEQYRRRINAFQRDKNNQRIFAQGEGFWEEFWHDGRMFNEWKGDNVQKDASSHGSVAEDDVTDDTIANTDHFDFMDSQTRSGVTSVSAGSIASPTSLKNTLNSLIPGRFDDLDLTMKVRGLQLTLERATRSLDESEARRAENEKKLKEKENELLSLKTAYASLELVDKEAKHANGKFVQSSLKTLSLQAEKIKSQEDELRELKDARKAYQSRG